MQPMPSLLYLMPYACTLSFSLSLFFLFFLFSLYFSLFIFFFFRSCTKDLFAGRFINCNGRSDFSPIRNVNGATECEQLCKAEPGCRFFAVYSGVICNLHLVTTCSQVSTMSANQLYEV